jgi:uncharacterized Zn-finger protein
MCAARNHLHVSVVLLICFGEVKEGNWHGSWYLGIGRKKEIGCLDDAYTA